MLRTALKEATWVFVLSRFTILLVSYICVVLLPQSGQILPLNCTTHIHLSPCVLAWYHFDAIVYAFVADKGYSFTPYVAFFPLWPLLIHFGSLPLQGYFPFSSYVAGLLLANICFYFALVLLYCLLYEDFDASLAKKALFYLAFYPYALFFFLGYTESFFLLLKCSHFFVATTWEDARLVVCRGESASWQRSLVLQDYYSAFLISSCTFVTSG